MSGRSGEIALLLAASPFSGVNMYASAVSWVMAQMRWFSSPLVSSLKSRWRPSYVQPKSKSGRADLVNRLAEPKSSTGATHRLPSVGGRGRKVRDRRNLVARWGVREGQKSTRQGKAAKGRGVTAMGHQPVLFQRVIRRRSSPANVTDARSRIWRTSWGAIASPSPLLRSAPVEWRLISRTSG